MEKAIAILQGLLDRHASRKNCYTFGKGDPCECEDCASVRKAIKKLKVSNV